MQRAEYWNTRSPFLSIAEEPAVETADATASPGHLAVDPSRIGRSVIRMAWPLFFERLSFATLSLVDLVLVGNFVGDDALAGVGIATMLWWLADIGVIGLEVGTTTVVGWDYGGRRTSQMTETLQTAMTIAVAWGIAALGFIVLFAGLFMRLMGLEGDAAAEGRVYLFGVAPSIIGFGVYHVCAGAYRGMGNSRYPMFVLIVINAINAVVAYLLMSGTIGIEMGTLGSGIGTTFGATAGGLVMLASLAKGYETARWRPGLGRPFVSNARRLLHISVPAALEEMVFLFAFLLYARIVSALGETATAAHALAMRSVDLAVMPSFALGTAATALVGQSMGARQVGLAERVARLAALYAMIVMTIYAVAMFFAAPYAARLFTDDPEVIDQATKALRVFTIAFPAMGIHFALAGSLRGAGDVLIITAILFITAFLVRVPVAFLGAHVLDLGLAGAWMGAMIEVNVRASLTATRFFTGRWKRRQV